MNCNKSLQPWELVATRDQLICEYNRALLEVDEYMQQHKSLEPNMSIQRMAQLQDHYNIENGIYEMKEILNDRNHFNNIFDKMLTVRNYII